MAVSLSPLFDYMVTDDWRKKPECHINIAPVEGVDLANIPIQNTDKENREIIASSTAVVVF